MLLFVEAGILFIKWKLTSDTVISIRNECISTKSRKTIEQPSNRCIDVCIGNRYLDAQYKHKITGKITK